MPFSPQNARFCCLNASCADYGKTGNGNITVYNRYGRDRRRLLKCRTCSQTFSERRFSLWFGLHTKESTIKEVIASLLDGRSFREAADTSGVDKDTVLRIWKRFVAYCEESVDDLLKEFNIKLEDLIILLYERKGCSRRSPDASRPSGDKAVRLWETLYNDHDLSDRRLCSGHE